MRTRLPVAVCVLLSAICLTSIAFAQSNWERTYGGTRIDNGSSVLQTVDGGYMIAGSTESFGAGDSDVYIIKTNALGDTLWTRTYGGPRADAGSSIQQTADGGYIIAGRTTSFGAGDSDVYVIRTNALGDTLWTRTYGGPGPDMGYSVQQTTDGCYIVAGSTGSFGAGNDDVYLIKINAQGDTLWTRTYGGARTDQGTGVQQTTDGGYIITGFTVSFGAGKEDVYLIKTDAQGDTLWTRTFGGPDNELGITVEQTADGGYFITGWTSWPFDVYLIKTNAQGDTLWTRTYGGSGFDVGCAGLHTTDGGYIIAGWTDSYGAGGQDVYLLKTNAQGDTLWTRTYGGQGDDMGVAVRQTADGGYIITGYTYSFGAGGSDVYLIKTDDNVDAGAITILSLPGIAESGRVYEPTAIVRNFGLAPAVFPVTLDIGASYAETMQETLASGISDTVAFPPWTAEPMGSLAVRCFTSLLGDEDPTNDTIRDSIQVVPPPRHDVGAMAILSPSGILLPGDTVIPRARIRNFGNTVERFFDVRFGIGTSYSRTVNAAQMLYPDSTVELTFAPWVAAPGIWAVSCSTMLVSDVNQANNKVSSSLQVLAQSLQVKPDQSGRLQAGQTETYRFYALVQGDTGGVVEVARPSAPAGWNLRLGNATGAQDLTDTDDDGIPDLGYVAPGESSWFSLDVTTPSGLTGDTASLASRTFLIAGHLGDDSLVADTAVLSLTLVPTFSVHNFPNPFSNHTAFVIGLPDDGKASLTVYTRAGAGVCRVLQNADLPAGVHVVRWDGVNDNGRAIAPGTYEYVLDYEHADKTDRISKKLVLTRQ